MTNPFHSLHYANEVIGLCINFVFLIILQMLHVNLKKEKEKRKQTALLLVQCSMILLRELTTLAAVGLLVNTDTVFYINFPRNKFKTTFFSPLKNFLHTLETLDEKLSWMEVVNAATESLQAEPQDKFEKRKKSVRQRLTRRVCILGISRRVTGTDCECP